MSTCVVPKGTFAAVVCVCAAGGVECSTERPDDRGLPCRRTRSPKPIFYGIFTFPVWSLEAVREGASLEDVRKTAARVLSKRWYRL